MAFLSIVSPVYKAENIVSVLVERLNRVVSEITDDYEIILIEDGSPDNSWSEIKKAASVYTNVKGIQLSRNFASTMPFLPG
jgi:dolichol-phosphate mannosyltransferase